MTAKSGKPSAKALNIISALLMVVLLACQFMPYWRFGEGETLSIQGYVWFPTKHPALTEELLPLVEKFPCNQAVMACIPVMILCLLGVWFCLSKSGKPLIGLLPVLTGAVGLLMYLTSPVMRAGMLCWLHVAVLALLLVTGILTLAGKKQN